MINFNLSAFMFAVWAVRQIRAEFSVHLASETQTPLSPMDKERLQGVLQFARDQCVKIGLESPEHRFERMFTDLRTIPQVTHAWGVVELGILIEAIEDDSKFQRFYHYPPAKGRLLLTVPADWESTLRVFPALRDAVTDAVDCYALGQNLACVFHLMRIMEVGVQRFGRKLGVPATARQATKIKDKTWHDILNEINPKLKAMTATTAARKAKIEQYSAIQSYLYGVKDAWRNPTMHPRAQGYVDLQTLDLINHVRAFMNGLASAL